MKRRPFKKFPQINSVIWFLTMNDIFTWGLFFILSILSGLYISEKLGVSATEIVGIGAGVAYLTRGLIQIPIGMIGDRIDTEKDELILLIIGNLLMGLSVFLLTQISSEFHYYFLQFIFGIGASLNTVDWRKIFAKNLDKGKEGLEYAIYDTAMSLSIAMMSILSGSIASIGFEYFTLVIGTLGVLMIASNVWIIPLYIQQKFPRK